MHCLVCSISCHKVVHESLEAFVRPFRHKGLAGHEKRCNCHAVASVALIDHFYSDDNRLST